jgi:hypothetical protein
MSELAMNIDLIRAEIMRLENATVFLRAPWDRVIAELVYTRQLGRLSDALRRMETARKNQRVSVETEGVT